jgi:outer membrane protein assembly factor BamB
VDRADTGNSDGKLTKAEMQAFVGKRPIPEQFFKKTFDKGDANKDGQLEGPELDVAFLHGDNFAGAKFDATEHGAEYILAVRGGGRGDVTDTHLAWKHETKHTDHIVSPLVSNGRMLLIKGGGIATCFDTAKGKNLYGPTRIQNAGEYFASPILGDGKIYIAGENGKIVVLKDSSSLEILAVNDLGDAVLGTPAIVDDTLFVRTRTHLYAFSNTATASAK